MENGNERQRPDTASAAEEMLKRYLKEQQLFTSGRIRDTPSEPLLSDLHAHLMGMGDAVFWKTVVMTDVIPSLLLTGSRGDDRWIEYLEGGPAAASFADLQTLSTALTAEKKSAFRAHVKEKNNDPTAEAPFTFDVVYSVQTLCKGLGRNDEVLSEAEPSPEQVALMRTWALQKLRSREGVDATKLFQWFWVFNAREQKFERRYGVTNTSFLLAFFHSNEDIVNNFFEMTAGEGGVTKHQIAEELMNEFTPQFYPRRFCMKDDMYSQYPIILDVLLRCMLNKYAQVGVSYVEFSVGFGDLVERPWIFTHLSRPYVGELTFGAFDVPALPSRVTYRYLAGFNRRHVHDKCRLTFDKGDNAEWIAHNAAFFCHDKQTGVNGNYFQRHLRQLDQLKTAFATSRTRKSTSSSSVCPLHDMCVGLDYFGDELYYPHCSFAHRNFTNFLMQERERRNGHFGFRIHAGELFNYRHKAFMYVHMGVVASNICTILKHFEDETTARPPPLRIGHGTGFLSFLREGWENASPISSTTPRTVHELHLMIHVALRRIHELKIPIEVNLTSDCCLLGTEQMGTAAKAAVVFNPDTVYSFLKQRFRVVVCSDNDGILRIQLGKYHSVAAELIRCCRSTNRDTALQVHDLTRLLGNYNHAAFGRRNEEKQLVDSETTRSEGLC